MRLLVLLLCTAPLACSSSSGGDAPSTSTSDSGADAASPGSDAAASDAGTDSAVPPIGSDAGSDAGANTGSDAGGGCAGGGYLLCEDFEKGTLDTSVWAAHTNNGATLAVDATRARGGTHALHVTAPRAAGAEADITETTTFGAAKSTFYGRAMVYVSPSAPDTHAALVVAKGADATYTLASQNQKLMGLAYFANNETANNSSTAMPVGVWSCLEWKFDGAAGTADYWLDGASLADMNATGWGKTTFDSLTFGVLLFGADGTASSYEYWYDDIAIATARIGCP